MSIQGFGVTEWITIAGGMAAILALIGGLVMSSATILQSYGLTRAGALIVTFFTLVVICLLIAFKTNFFGIVAYLLRGGA